MTNPGNGNNNNTYPEWNNRSYSETELTADRVPLILTSVILMICLFILVGNGIVFCVPVIKLRINKINVYILNLAVANFIFITGFLVYMGDFVCYFAEVDVSEPIRQKIYLVAGILLDIGFSVSGFLIASISVERCLSVFLTFWHHRQESQRKSAWICVFSWLLCCLVTVLEMICVFEDSYQKPMSEACTALYYSTSLLYVIVLFIMMLTTIILLIEFEKTSKKSHPLCPHVVIAITVLISFLDFLTSRLVGILKYFCVLTCNVYTWYSYYLAATCTSTHFSATPKMVNFVGESRKQWLEGTVKQ